MAQQKQPRLSCVESIRVFHGNGQRAEELTAVKGKKRGPWLRDFDDATPDLQAEYVANEMRIVYSA